MRNRESGKKILVETITPQTTGSDHSVGSEQPGLEAKLPVGPALSVLANVIAVIGVYLCFLSHGVMQELVYSIADPKTGQLFKFPLVLVAFSCLCSGLLGVIINGFRSTKVTRSLKTLYPSNDIARQGCLTAVTYAGAMLASNYALTQVNYPTQVSKIHFALPHPFRRC